MNIPESMSEKIISAMQEAVILIDSHFTVITANHAFLNLSGYQLNDLVGKASIDFFRLYDAKKPNFESRLRTKTGDLVPVYVSRTPIKNKEDKIEGFIYVSHGIENINELYARLHKTETLMERMKTCIETVKYSAMY